MSLSKHTSKVKVVFSDCSSRYLWTCLSCYACHVVATSIRYLLNQRFKDYYWYLISILLDFLQVKHKHWYIDYVVESTFIDYWINGKLLGDTFFSKWMAVCLDDVKWFTMMLSFSAILRFFSSIPLNDDCFLRCYWTAIAFMKNKQHDEYWHHQLR